MPRAAKPASRGGKSTRAGASASAPALPDTVTVRMLYGERAGQIVQVTRTQAVDLCGGWTPRAEPVAVKPADRRETR